MAHEILAVKLCQLDDRLCRLHSRIHMSETASLDRLRQEIDALERECLETDEILSDKLQRSRSPLTGVLSEHYRQIETIIQETGSGLQKLACGRQDAEAAAEDQILLAEYALDFAQRAADRALLLSLEAIEAQLMQEERRNA